MGEIQTPANMRNNDQHGGGIFKSRGSPPRQAFSGIAQETYGRELERRGMHDSSGCGAGQEASENVIKGEFTRKGPNRLGSTMFPEPRFPPFSSFEMHQSQDPVELGAVNPI